MGWPSVGLTTDAVTWPTASDRAVPGNENRSAGNGRRPVRRNQPDQTLTKGVLAGKCPTQERRITPGHAVETQFGRLSCDRRTRCRRNGPFRYA